MEPLIFIQYAMIFILWLLFLNAVISKATSYGRTQGFWIIIAIIFTPIIAIILLLIEGETDEHRLQRIKEEEKVRREV